MRIKRWITFYGSEPCGTIGNVDVYKTGNGYVLVDQYDNSKFMFIPKE